MRSLGSSTVLKPSSSLENLPVAKPRDYPSNSQMGTLNQSSSVGRNNVTVNMTAIVSNSPTHEKQQASPTQKIDSMMRFGDSYAKQIEKKKKVLEVLTARLEDVQKRIDDYRREKQRAPKSNAGKSP